MTAIQGSVSKFLSLADGTLRIQIDVHDRYSQEAKSLLCDVGATVALARLRDDHLPAGPSEDGDAADEGQPDGQAEPSKDPLTGQILASFYKSGFFISPKTLKALGPDYEFLTWLRNQPCCWHCGVMDSKDNPIQAAHYRKVGDGAGTGTKPPYSAIALCSNDHMIQHSAGYSALAPVDWWESQVLQARELWGHLKLREKFTVKSVSEEVSADDLVTWLYANKLGNFLRAAHRTELQKRQREAAPGSAGGVGEAAVVEG